MPIHKVKGGWKWGKHGKVYRSRKKAAKQAAAAYAHGYKEDLGDLVAEAHAILEGVSVKYDTKAVEGLLDDLIDSLLDRTAAGKSEYSKQDAAKDRTHYVRELKKSAEKIGRLMTSAAGRIPTWTGSKIAVKLLPLSSSFGDTFMTDEGDVTDFAEISVFKKSENNAPSFTYFGGTTVDDVLDAGDSDFFGDPEVEQDYFALVNEIRNPGKSKREGEKVIRLFTARPSKDRQQFQRSKTLPSNLFLTTSEDEAEGYARDFGSRDIWVVRIKKKHLVQTLDTPRAKNYQTFGAGGKVPVEAMDLVAPGN
jgi:hypothetical protein